MGRPPAKSSALRKFERGVEQVRRLCSEIEDYERASAYEFGLEVEARTPRSITYRCVATEREPPSDEWPLLAGEAIQNLRSSLDHVIWAKAESPTRQNAFPICSAPHWFKKAVKRGRLHSVPDTVRATVERWQPYHRSPDAPAVAMLEQLRELSDHDKHRMLTAVATVIGHDAVGVDEGVGIKWLEPGIRRRLDTGDTHVSTFVATSESGVEDLPVEVLYSYEVRIEDRRIERFRGIVDEVYRVLFECETGRPLSPFESYPI